MFGKTSNAGPGLVACTLVMPEMTGRSATGDTVSVNESEFVLAPSLTSTVMVAEPLMLALGVNVMVRLVPAPPKIMPALSIRFVLLDERVRTMLASGVSGSLIVNAMFVVPSSGMVLLLMFEIWGGYVRKTTWNALVAEVKPLLAYIVA